MGGGEFRGPLAVDSRGVRAPCCGEGFAEERGPQAPLGVWLPILPGLSVLAVRCGPRGVAAAAEEGE